MDDDLPPLVSDADSDGDGEESSDGEHLTRGGLGAVIPVGRVP